MTKTQASDAAGFDELALRYAYGRHFFLGYGLYFLSRRRRRGILIQIWHFTGQISRAFLTTNETDGVTDWNV